jgi:hypothetical protein
MRGLNMLKFEEINNKNRMLCCNKCCKDDAKLYNLEFPLGSNQTMIIRLCKECSKELRDSIKFRK